MSIILPAAKSPYSRTIPPFDFPEITDSEIDKYRGMQFVIYTSVVEGDKFPLVIAIHPERLHVYNDVAELKYNAFNQDLYSGVIGECEISLRQSIPGYVLYGFINTKSEIEVFHIWDFNKRLWQDTNQFGAFRFKITPIIKMPKIYTRGSFGELPRFACDCFVKSVNDPALFFVNRCRDITGKEE